MKKQIFANFIMLIVVFIGYSPLSANPILKTAPAEEEQIQKSKKIPLTQRLIIKAMQKKWKKKIQKKLEENCDIIYTMEQQEIEAKVKEIKTGENVSYVMCNYQDGPMTVMPISSICKIRYASGDLVYFGCTPPQQTTTIPQKSNSRRTRVDGFSIAGLVLAFFFPFLGLIFSSIGIARTNRRSDLSGRGMAIAGLVLSLIFILAIATFLGIGLMVV